MNLILDEKMDLMYLKYVIALLVLCMYPVSYKEVAAITCETWYLGF